METDASIDLPSGPIIYRRAMEWFPHATARSFSVRRTSSSWPIATTTAKPRCGRRYSPGLAWASCGRGNDGQPEPVCTIPRRFTCAPSALPPLPKAGLLHRPTRASLAAFSRPASVLSLGAYWTYHHASPALTNCCPRSEPSGSVTMPTVRPYRSPTQPPVYQPGTARQQNPSGRYPANGLHLRESNETHSL